MGQASCLSWLGSLEAGKQADLVVTMLPSSSHVEAVYLGAGGVLEGAAKGRLCVDMSTIEPAVSRRVAERLGSPVQHARPPGVPTCRCYPA